MVGSEITLATKTTEKRPQRVSLHFLQKSSKTFAVKQKSPKKIYGKQKSLKFAKGFREKKSYGKQNSSKKNWHFAGNTQNIVFLLIGK